MLKEKSPFHTASTMWFHVCNVLEMTAVKRRRVVEGYQRPRVGHWGGHGYRRAAWRVDPSCILTVVWMQTHMSCNSAWYQIHTCVRACWNARENTQDWRGGCEYTRLPISLCASGLDCSFVGNQVKDTGLFDLSQLPGALQGSQ